MSEVVNHINDDEFDATVLNATLPVLVDFWAEWCGPCKMIAPILDNIANRYEGKLSVVKLNIDQNSQTPQRYGIRSIPTLMLFNNGELVATKVGALNESQLTAFIDTNLSLKPS